MTENLRIVWMIERRACGRWVRRPGLVSACRCSAGRASRKSSLSPSSNPSRSTQYGGTEAEEAVEEVRSWRREVSVRAERQ